jgi:hypothetical protein
MKLRRVCPRTPGRRETRHGQIRDDAASLDALIFKSTAMTTATDTLPTGPSFAAALCGFLSTTAATTMLMLLVRSF